MNVAILGAGPAGMLATHAASNLGHHVDILDANPNKIRSHAGVFFLHEDCDLLLDGLTIKQTILGGHALSPDGIDEMYSKKVYGDLATSTSVLEAFRHPTTFGYNAKQAVDRLWDLYGKQVAKQSIPDMKWVIENIFPQYDKVISTIPASVLFPEFEYRSVEVWVKVGKAPENEAFLFYNVSPHCHWTRCSAIWGMFAQEYELGHIPFLDNAYQFKPVNKILYALSEKSVYGATIANGQGRVISKYPNLFLTGRYGAWDKSCLAHHAYSRSLAWLENER